MGDADSAAVSVTADANAEATILPSMISFAVPLLRLHPLPGITCGTDVRQQTHTEHAQWV